MIVRKTRTMTAITLYALIAENAPRVVKPATIRNGMVAIIRQHDMSDRQIGRVKGKRLYMVLHAVNGCTFGNYLTYSDACAMMQEIIDTGIDLSLINDYTYRGSLRGMISEDTFNTLSVIHRKYVNKQAC